jgi:hypothetical protein
MTRSTIRGALRAAVMTVLVALVSVPVAEAQQPTPRDTADIRRQVEQRMGPGITEAELVERLRQSGMTRSQARARLQQMGYDPGLVDRYYDAIERGAEPPRGRPTDETLRTLQQLGVDLRDVRTEGFIGDTLAIDTIAPDTLQPDTLRDGLTVFGRDLFRRITTQFQPVTTGPVDPDYRSGRATRWCSCSPVTWRWPTTLR